MNKLLVILALLGALCTGCRHKATEWQLEKMHGAATKWEEFVRETSHFTNSEYSGDVCQIYSTFLDGVTSKGAIFDLHSMLVPLDPSLDAAPEEMERFLQNFSLTTFRRLLEVYRLLPDSRPDCGEQINLRDRDMLSEAITAAFRSAKVKAEDSGASDKEIEELGLK